MRALEDYATVAERIQQFYERYPEGSLVTSSGPNIVHVAERSYVVVSAKAYRTPDDPHPGEGWAWEPVPGPTPFTFNSELQNAETAAWGRAIVALGFETKKGIASREEVEARRDEPKQPDPPPLTREEANLIDQIQRLWTQGRTLDEELGHDARDWTLWTRHAVGLVGNDAAQASHWQKAIPELEEEIARMRAELQQRLDQEQLQHEADVAGQAAEAGQQQTFVAPTGRRGEGH